jgi:transcriptional regulator with XRE-family HTH domain
MLRLKAWRLENGLTQTSAALALKLGASTLALLESGRLQPSPAQLEQLRVVFRNETGAMFQEVQEQPDPAVI